MQFRQLGTGRRVLVQTALGDAPQRLGHPVQPRLLVHDLIARQVRAGAVEGAVAGGRVDQQRAEREDVGGGRDVPGRRELLRGHERRGADQPAGDGEGLVVGGAGDAEVDDAGAVLREQDVARLQVPVHHARLMDVPQRLDQSQRERAQGAARQRAVPLDDFGQRAAGHVQRGHPRHLGVRVGVHDGRGEGAAHPAGRRDLLPEAGPELLVQRVLRVHHLDGDLPSRGRPPEIHDAHPAAAEPVDQRVSADRLRVPGAKRHVAGHLPDSVRGRAVQTHHTRAFVRLAGHRPCGTRDETGDGPGKGPGIGEREMGCGPGAPAPSMAPWCPPTDCSPSRPCPSC